MSDIWGILRHLAGIWVGSLNVKEKLIKMMKKSEFLGKGIASWKKEKLHLWRKEICSLGVCVEVKEETGQRTEKKRRNTHQSHVSRAKHRKQCTELQSTNSEAHVLCVSGPTSWNVDSASQECCPGICIIKAPRGLGAGYLCPLHRRVNMFEGLDTSEESKG